MGITLKLNYEKGYVEKSVPWYIDKVIRRCTVESTKGADSPHVWITPTYGAKQQFMAGPDTSLCNTCSSHAVFVGMMSYNVQTVRTYKEEYYVGY